MSTTLNRTSRQKQYHLWIIMMRGSILPASLQRSLLPSFAAYAAHAGQSDALQNTKLNQPGIRLIDLLLLNHIWKDHQRPMMKKRVRRWKKVKYYERYITTLLVHGSYLLWTAIVMVGALFSSTYGVRVGGKVCLCVYVSDIDVT
jgi:hypothetical protein